MLEEVLTFSYCEEEAKEFGPKTNVDLFWFCNEKKK